MSNPFAGVPITRDASEEASDNPFASVPITRKPNRRVSAPDQARGALDQVREFFRHPIDSGKAIIEGAARSAADFLDTPVEGEEVSVARANRGKGGNLMGAADAARGKGLPAGTIITKENTPAAITRGEFRRAAINTGANIALPLTPGGAVLRVGSNAALGAINDPDQPIRGALAGTVLGEVVHGGAKVPGLINEVRGIRRAGGVDLGAVVPADLATDLGFQAQTEGAQRVQPPGPPGTIEELIEQSILPGLSRRGTRRAAPEPPGVTTPPGLTELDPVASSRTGPRADVADRIRALPDDPVELATYLRAQARDRMGIAPDAEVRRRPAATEVAAEGAADQPPPVEIPVPDEPASLATATADPFASVPITRAPSRPITKPIAAATDVLNMSGQPDDVGGAQRLGAVSFGRGTAGGPEPVVSSNGVFEARPGVMRRVNREFAGPETSLPVPPAAREPTPSALPDPQEPAVASAEGVRPVPPASDLLNVAKLNLGDVTAQQRVAQQLEQYRELRDTNRQTFAEADVNRREIMNELLANDPKALVPAVAKKLSGEELLARRDVVQQNDQLIAELSKSIESKALSVADHEQATQLLQKAVEHNDALLSDLVVGSSQKGRDLNLLRRMANRSLEPEVWLVQAKRMLGDRPLTDEIHATIRKLSQAAIDACAGGA